MTRLSCVMAVQGSWAERRVRRLAGSRVGSVCFVRGFERELVTAAFWLGRLTAVLQYQSCVCGSLCIGVLLLEQLT
jgi:hypothetical protein